MWNANRDNVITLLSARTMGESPRRAADPPPRRVSGRGEGGAEKTKKNVSDNASGEASALHINIPPNGRKLYTRPVYRPRRTAIRLTWFSERKFIPVAEPHPGYTRYNKSVRGSVCAFNSEYIYTYIYNILNAHTLSKIIVYRANPLNVDVRIRTYYALCGSSGILTTLAVYDDFFYRIVFYYYYRVRARVADRVPPSVYDFRRSVYRV